MFTALTFLVCNLYKMYPHNLNLSGLHPPYIYMSGSHHIITVFRLLKVLSAVSHEFFCPFDWQLSRLGQHYIFHIQYFQIKHIISQPLKYMYTFFICRSHHSKIFKFVMFVYYCVQKYFFS